MAAKQFGALIAMPTMRAEYRVTVFGEPKAEWRETYGEAKQDAIALRLASWDQSTREWFIAVPVDIERRYVPDLRPVKPYKVYKRLPRKRPNNLN